jgi:predicted enzyme related to lactoylglutathione lyase
MLKDAQTFSSFSVDDIHKALEFYQQTLGVDAEIDEDMDILMLHLGGDGEAIAYPKSDHEPATFTILNFVVEDIEEAVDVLMEQGVAFITYDEDGLKTNDKGISEGPGPRIAWFHDSAGNILSVLETT